MGLGWLGIRGSGIMGYPQFPGFSISFIHFPYFNSIPMYSPSLDHKAAKCGSLLVGHLVPHGLAWHPWLQDRLHLQQRTGHENSELPTLPPWRLSIQQLLRTIASDWNLNLSCLTKLTKCNGPFLGTRCCYWQQDSMQVPLTTEESLYERRKNYYNPQNKIFPA